VVTIRESLEVNFGHYREVALSQGLWTLVMQLGARRVPSIDRVAARRRPLKGFTVQVDQHSILGFYRGFNFSEIIKVTMNYLFAACSFCGFLICLTLTWHLHIN
jgi:hypothetical protein